MPRAGGPSSASQSRAHERRVPRIATTYMERCHVNLSPDIDLERSLRQVFANQPGSEQQIQGDCARQMATGEAILEKFFTRDPEQRREISILADEVGLGKTYMALAVAVSILDAIRRGRGPSDLPANRPAILVLTPNNDALYNKWKRV